MTIIILKSGGGIRGDMIFNFVHPRSLSPRTEHSNLSYRTVTLSQLLGSMQPIKIRLYLLNPAVFLPSSLPLAQLGGPQLGPGKGSQRGAGIKEGRCSGFNFFLSSFLLSLTQSRLSVGIVSKELANFSLSIFKT